MLQKYQKISRYIFVAALIVFGLIIGGIWLQTKRQSKCLARLLPTAGNPEIFAGTIDAPLDVTQPVLLIRSKDNLLQWLGEKQKLADFFPFTILVWPGHSEKPLHFEKIDPNHGLYLFTTFKESPAILVPTHRLEPKTQFQVQLISGALAAGEITEIELYDNVENMVSTIDTLIGFLLALSMLFLMIINNVRYPAAAAPPPQPPPAPDEPENRQ